MIEISKLADCTIEQAVEAWNKGFEGYYIDMTTTPEAFEKRMVQEELSKDLSLIAFDGDQPVGIVLSGIRNSGGKKVAWNGGTGVAPLWRKKGVGQQLMETALKILKEQEVETATLEAISGNDKAIELYKKLGYEIVDELHFMKLDGEVKKWDQPFAGRYEIRGAEPEETGALPFYRGDFPWQNHWQSVRDGEGVVALEASGRLVGYAFYRRLKDEQETHFRTILYQCETEQDSTRRDEITKALLNSVFENFEDAINRTAANVPVNTNAWTYNILKDLGFEKNIAQVFMKKTLKE